MERIPLSSGVLDLERRRIERNGQVIALTDREVAVLVRLRASVGAVVTREALERDVWNLAPSVRSEAVPVAMRRLRDKLEVDPEHPVHLHVVRGTGWTFVLPELPAPAAQTPNLGEAPALFGREADVAELAVAARVPGWITVWGAPGIGKTVLAKVAGAVVRDALSVDVVWWVDVDGAGSVQTALGSALGLTEDASLEVALPRGPCLFAVDVRGDGLPDDVAGAVAGWLTLRPELRVWLVARSTTGDPRERPMLVGGLARSASHALFVARAAADGSTDAERDALLAHLGDVPLAIELAAAATAVCTPAEIAARAQVGRIGEHLRAVFAWSAGLLSGPSRELLGRLTAFEGWFERGWADALAGLDATDGLSELVARRLVHARVGGAGEPARSFRVDPSIRAFASEDRPADTEDRHLAWVLALGEASIPALAGPDAVAASERLRRIDADLAAAARRAPPAIQARLQWVRWLELRARGVTSPNGFPLGVAVPEAAGRAGAALAACRALARWIDDPHGSDALLAWAADQDDEDPWVLACKARRALIARDWPAADLFARAAHAASVARADPFAEVEAALLRGFALEYQGDDEGASRVIRRALAAARARGHRHGQVELLTHRAYLDRRTLVDQLAVLDEVIALASGLGAVVQRVRAEILRVDVLITLDRIAEARDTIDAARADLRSCRPAEVARMYEIDAELALLEDRLDDVDTVAAFALSWRPVLAIAGSEGTVRVIAALAEARRGDLAAAIDVVRPAAERPSRIQRIADAVLAGLLAWDHRRDEARSRLAAAQEVPYERELNATFDEVARGFVAVEAGDRVGAEQLAAAASSRQPTGVARVWCALLRRRLADGSQ